MTPHPLSRLLRFGLLSFMLLAVLGFGPAGLAGPDHATAAGGLREAAQPSVPPAGAPTDPHAQHVHPGPAGTGVPSLSLTWAEQARETHVRVPIDLHVQALTAEGQPDATRTGTA